MLSVSDFFCGCGGLSQGFKEAGFSIKAGIDFNKSFLDTYAHNFPEAEVLNLDLGNSKFLEKISYSDVVENLKKDKEIVLIAVKENGINLEYADESLKKDREIVLAAVKNAGHALEYANESLKKDREIVLAAVKNFGTSLSFADESLKKDKVIVLAAVKQDAYAMNFTNDTRFFKDKDFRDYLYELEDF